MRSGGKGKTKGRTWGRKLQKKRRRGAAENRVAVVAAITANQRSALPQEPCTLSTLSSPSATVFFFFPERGSLPVHPVIQNNHWLSQIGPQWFVGIVLAASKHLNQASNTMRSVATAAVICHCDDGADSMQQFLPSAFYHETARASVGTCISTASSWSSRKAGIFLFKILKQDEGWEQTASLGWCGGCVDGSFQKNLALGTKQTALKAFWGWGLFFFTSRVVSQLSDEIKAPTLEIFFTCVVGPHSECETWNQQWCVGSVNWAVGRSQKATLIFQSAVEVCLAKKI